MAQHHVGTPLFTLGGGAALSIGQSCIFLHISLYDPEQEFFQNGPPGSPAPQVPPLLSALYVGGLGKRAEK